jgi:hypothetical protein
MRLLLVVRMALATTQQANHDECGALYLDPVQPMHAYARDDKV